MKRLSAVLLIAAMALWLAPTHLEAAKFPNKPVRLGHSLFAGRLARRARARLRERHGTLSGPAHARGNPGGRRRLHRSELRGPARGRTATP